MIVFWRGRRLCLGVAAVLLILAGGATFAARHVVAATVATAEVVIDNFAFGPGTITVQRGTTVTWLNKDDEPHTVVSDADPRLWKSPPLDTDEKFSFTFDRPGTFKYFCTVHPRMQGTVIVQ